MSPNGTYKRLFDRERNLLISRTGDETGAEKCEHGMHRDCESVLLSGNDRGC
jgi:hypothetical protein